jgi:arylsulfatase A-like enzyme
MNRTRFPSSGSITTEGRFDRGWDVIRKEAFDRQKALGVIPANAELTPRPDGLPAWDSLTAEQKKLLAHQAEVYAGYTEQTDYEVGRLLDAIREEGSGDNTVVFWIFGDNGASAEGGLEGHDARDVNGKPRPSKRAPTSRTCSAANCT